VVHPAGDEAVYRDVGTADGPFIHFLHAGIQAVFGIADREFRKGDLFLHATGAALIGLLLAPRLDLPQIGRVLQRLTWTAVAAGVWLAWYLTLDWSVTTERETYYALFGSLGMILLYTSGSFSARWAAVAAFAGGLLVTSQVFGKPTGAAYLGLGAWCLAFKDAEGRTSRRHRLKMAAAGAGACVLLVLVALLISGSIRDYVLWCFTIPYRGNMFLFRVDWLRLLFVHWDPFRLMAVLSLVGGGAAVAAGLLPRKAIPLVCTPMVLFLGACLQGRGYLYQVTPTAAATNVLMLAALASLWRGSSLLRWSSQRGVLAAGALVFVTYYFFDGIQKSPFEWNGKEAGWTEPAHQFGIDEKKVGAFIKENTHPDDYVFAYSAGENAHVVLLHAERRTASTFLHSFWLDPIGLLPQSEEQPNDEQRAALESLQNRIRERACGAVQARQPAAMAFNLLEQVFKVCPNVKGMLETQYVRAATFGAYGVYLRKKP
jgi:hypothetical protein